jgi:hypothetical protein
VTGEERLAFLYGTLRDLGLPCLVMGGHAVRFYGVDRVTIDYDMHVALDESVWSGLREELLRAPFDQLWERRSEGPYGNDEVAFLGLHDLIRSKETEREDDWRDVALLEEVADERCLAAAEAGGVQPETLSRLRSRRGYDRALRAGLLADATLVEAACALAAAR